MSFPGTYNISYYYGDTLEFRVYPKNSAGEVFDLGTFTLSRFTLAPTRDALEEDKISCYAAIDSNKDNILCAIRPADADKLNPDTDYVYDVEIKKSNPESYDLVYTVLTGTVSITRDITKATTNLITERPNNPTNLTLIQATSSTIEVSWTPPVGGGLVEFYRIVAIPFTTNQTSIAAAVTESSTLISGNTTRHVFFGLEENTDYSIIILSNNGIGNALTSTVLTNSTAFRTLDNPLTVEPDFIITNDGSVSYIVDDVVNDTITLIRGETYIFRIQATGHPFWIQEISGGYSAENVYSDGIVNNGEDFGNIVFTVQESTPDNLYYASENSLTMNGDIEIIDGGS
jgi:hypothetical protein